MIKIRIFYTILLFVLLSFVTIMPSAKAQTKFADGGSYMTYMSDLSVQISEDFLSYTSAVGHGKSARKVESKRLALIQSLKDAIKKISAMPPYQGDKSLRDSSIVNLNISYHILNDDYGKIVNMEEIAEQSYDAMEAYLLAQDVASDKAQLAGENLKKTEKVFAAKHNVNLIESKNKLSDKLEQASKVNDYHRIVYLIFFKSYKQEVYVMDALAKKNVNGIEQNNSTLEKYAEEGLSKLGSIPAFEKDASLTSSCKQSLEFYKMESKVKMPIISGFYLKEENYQKMKKAFDAKKESERTKEDVEQFNAAVNNYNKSINDYNLTNNALNDARSKVIQNWNKSSQAFLDKHTPKYR